ncbi:MAG: beta-lactamase family protein [Planctomycetes bacterium]|nr:beta-lactamase family protein [Planctomycetota bacterium]
MTNGRWGRQLAMLLAALLSTASLGAQQREDLGPLLAPIRAQHGVPALGAAVLVDGKLTALGVDGVRKHGAEAEVTEDDLWHLGSCTKAMTATWLAMLVEQGELSWTTTVAEAMPDLRDELHPSTRTITVERLLQHRAGLPAGPPRPLWLELFRYEGSDRQARTDVARALLTKPVEAKVGERFLYSNASYMIAGAIGERVTDRGWQQQLRTRLFAPLGMQRAGFGPPGERDALDQPWGHRRGAKGPVPVFADNPSALGPAGTVHASLADWARFAALHLGVQPDLPLLNEASLQRLRTPPDEGPYALGWNVTRRPWAKGPILTHSGSNTMWFCVAWLAPEAKFGVLVTCNQGDAAAACDAVAAACIRRFKR